MRLGHLNAIMQFVVHLLGWRRKGYRYMYLDIEIHVEKAHWD